MEGTSGKDIRMRELTQAETAAIIRTRENAREVCEREEKGEIVETTHLGSTIREYLINDLKILDSAARLPAKVKRKAAGRPDEGRALGRLLQKAAGLQDVSVSRISCEVNGKGLVLFTADIFGTAEDIAAAIAANEEEASGRYAKE
jgi:hypothetical protein